MVWYWHGHFTTAIDNVGAVLMWEQHRLVRKHALGNFRTLTKEMVEDGAMLVYLDGDGSQGDQPNENLARELMELFTLGVGNYIEDDVKAAALALSGYWVDWDTAEVTFEPEEHYDRPIQFLGSRSRFSAADIAALGTDNIDFNPWELEVSGQVPFNPPNVAGWSEGDRWVGGRQVRGRISRVLQLSWKEMIDTNIEPTVDDQPEHEKRLELLFTLTLASPEFALA